MAQRLTVHFDESIRWPLLVFVGVRIWLFVVASGTLAITGFEPTQEIIDKFYLGQSPADTSSLLAPWQRWDALWYTKIARWGYAPDDGSMNFFPLYPALVGIAGRALGSDFLLAGVVISNLACLALFIVFFRLATLELGPDTARRALLCLALFPTGFFLWAPYAESLFLLGVVASLYAARGQRWWIAGGFGMVAGLTKLQGVLVAAPLAWVWARYRLYQWRTGLVSSMPLLGALCFMIYRYFSVDHSIKPASDSIFNQPFILPTAAQSVWDWRFVMPWEGVGRAVGALLAPQDTLSFVRAGLELAWVACLIVATLVAWCRLSGFYALYMTVLLGGTLMWVDAVRPYSTIYKHGLLYFPVFMLLGVAGHRPWVHRSLIATFVPMQALFTAFFALWYWMGG